MKKFLSRFGYPIQLFLPKSERYFLLFIIACFISASVGVVAGPEIGMWVGFLFAAYAAVANDSIQTIGTFIASNQDKKWWVLWIFLGSIFLGTISYSWFSVDKTGLTVFYPNHLHDIYTKEVSGNDSVRIDNFWTKKDFKKLESFLEDKNEDGKYNLEFDVKYEGQKVIVRPILNSENFKLDDLNQINFSDAEIILDGSRIETYGISLFLNQNGDFDIISSISETEGAGIYTFGKNSLINYQGGSLDYQNIDEEDKIHQIGKAFFKDGKVDGDVTHARLSAKGFEQSPKKFHFLHIAAPIFLLILTRLRMPVSTTFILLTSFATSTKAIGGVLAKSMSGYILAFLIGVVVFLLISKLAKKYFTGEASFKWTIAQWITSGTLWSVWLMQDAANIAVYLDRSMSFWSFFGFCLIVVVGLGLLLYYKGGRIQRIVTEKSIVTDVRFATVIDFIYCIILFYFKLHSEVPMSTTWVFIGLLGGRELGMAIRRSGSNSIFKTGKLIFKDFSFAMIGLVISIAIAVGVNDQLTFTSMLTEIPREFGEGIVKFFGKLGL